MSGPKINGTIFHEVPLKNHFYLLLWLTATGKSVLYLRWILEEPRFKGFPCWERLVALRPDMQDRLDHSTVAVPDFPSPEEVNCPIPNRKPKHLYSLLLWAVSNDVAEEFLQWYFADENLGGIPCWDRVTTNDAKAESRAMVALEHLKKDSIDIVLAEIIADIVEVLQPPNLEEALQSDCASGHDYGTIERKSSSYKNNLENEIYELPDLCPDLGLEGDQNGAVVPDLVDQACKYAPGVELDRLGVLNQSSPRDVQEAVHHSGVAGKATVEKAFFTSGMLEIPLDPATINPKTQPQVMCKGQLLPPAPLAPAASSLKTVQRSSVKRSVPDIWDPPSSDDDAYRPRSSERSISCTPVNEKPKWIRLTRARRDCLSKCPTKYVDTCTQTEGSRLDIPADAAAADEDTGLQFAFHIRDQGDRKEIVLKIPVPSGAVLHVPATEHWSREETCDISR